MASQSKSFNIGSNSNNITGAYPAPVVFSASNINSIISLPSNIKIEKVEITFQAAKTKTSNIIYVNTGNVKVTVGSFSEYLKGVIPNDGGGNGTIDQVTRSATQTVTVPLSELSSDGLFNSSLTFTFDANGAGNPLTYWGVYDVKVIYKYKLGRTITLNKGQGCKQVSGAGNYYDDDQIQISAENDVGYTWGSWDDGNGDNPRTIVVSSDMDLTANFNPITYYVSYNNNGGIGTLPTQEFQYGIQKTLTPIGNSIVGPPLRLTYVYNDQVTSNKTDEINKNFSYWYDSEDPNNINKQYNDEELVQNLREENGDVVPLYAKWGNATTTLQQSPSRKYHQFLYWIDDDNNIYNAGEEISIQNNITLTAQWKKNKPRIFSGIDNIEKIYSRKNKKIEKIFVGTTEV